jgi:hypothetical protein
MKIGQTVEWVETTDGVVFDYVEPYKGMIISFDEETVIVQEIPWSMSKPLVSLKRDKITAD